MRSTVPRNLTLYLLFGLMFLAACSGQDTTFRAGNCVDGLRITGSTTQYVRENCGDLHTHEVVGVLDASELSDGAFPGTEALQTFNTDRCQALYDAYVTDEARRAEFRSTWFGVASEAGWDAGSREVTCLAELSVGAVRDLYLGEINSDDFCLTPKDDRGLSLKECAS